LLSGLWLLLLVTGCGSDKAAETVRLTGSTMGTSWSVTLRPDPAGIDRDVLQQQLQQRLDLINRLMSTYDPTSEVSRFNDQASSDWFAISAETAQVIKLSQSISALTGGAFDISVGPLVDLWGFGPPPRGDKLPAEKQVREVLARIGYQNILLRPAPAAIKKLIPDLRIDLSAVAKGFAVDQLADLLEQQGIDNYLLEIGGELRISGHRHAGKAWRIAIEKPLDGTREVATVFPLTETAVATSGDYRNFYLKDGQRYSHTIDPVTGLPSRHRLASVTVLDQSCARADALATALMVMGEEKGRRFCEENQLAAYFLIHENESIIEYTSPAFKAFMQKGSK
jgi:thiamine biosynthesis lipoprotein